MWLKISASLCAIFGEKNIGAPKFRNIFFYCFPKRYSFSNFLILIVFALNLFASFFSSKLYVHWFMAFFWERVQKSLQISSFQKKLNMKHLLRFLAVPILFSPILKQQNLNSSYGKKCILKKKKLAMYWLYQQKL